jgi:hypothetical protein
MRLGISRVRGMCEASSHEGWSEVAPGGGVCFTRGDVGKMDRARLLVRSREFRWLKTDIASSDAVKKLCILKFKNVKWSAFSGHVNILRGVLKQVSERRILFPMRGSTLLLPFFLRPNFPSTFSFWHHIQYPSTIEIIKNLRILLLNHCEAA